MKVKNHLKPVKYETSNTRKMAFFNKTGYPNATGKNWIMQTSSEKGLIQLNYRLLKMLVNIKKVGKKWK